MSANSSCILCGRNAVLMCQRCFDLYCSVQCQTTDWPQHKNVCIPLPRLVPANQQSGFGMPGTQQRITLIEVSDVRRPTSSAGPPILQANRPLRQLNDSKIEEKLSQSEQVVKFSIGQRLKPAFGVEQAKPILPEPIAKVVEQPKPDVPATPQPVKPEVTVTSPVKGLVKVVKPPIEKQFWRESHALEVNAPNPIKIIVVHVEKSGRIWVMPVDLELECKKLLRDNQKFCTGNLAVKPSPTQIIVGELFAAPFESMYFRVTVVEIMDPNNTQVRVRLIDYGNNELIETKRLLMPSPLMKNLKAFAIPADLQDPGHPIELESCFLVKVLVKNPITDVYQLVMVEQEKPNNLPPPDIFDLLVPKPGEPLEGTITICALPKKGLALGLVSAAPLKKVLQMLWKELPEKCAGTTQNHFKDRDSADEGEIVCYKFPGKGWCRVRVLHKFEDNYVVLALDTGSYEFISEQKCFKECWSSFANIAPQTLIVDLTKVLIDENEFYQTRCILKSEINFRMTEADPATREILCELSDSKTQLALAKLRKFDASLGLQRWAVPIASDTEVVITHIATVGNLYVCPPEQVNIYQKIFNKLYTLLPPITQTPKIDDIVLVVNAEGVAYRALIKQSLSAALARVTDIDTGVIDEIEMGKMVMANDFVRSLPIYKMPVKLSEIDCIAIDEQVMLIQSLEAAQRDKTKLMLKYVGSHRNGVKLLNVKTKRSIFVEVIEKREKEAEVVVSKPAPEVKDDVKLPPESPRLMYNDLVTRGITVGNDVKLSLIDTTGIEKGFVTVCDFDKNNATLYEQISKSVNKYGKAQANAGPYYPIHGEILIAIFPDDNDWYRAICVSDPKEIITRVELMFIDYCNKAMIEPKNIRKMPKELMLEAVAQSVEIVNLKLPLTKQFLAQFTKWMQRGFFIAKKIAKTEDGEYAMTLHDLAIEFDDFKEF